jgi:hypothetical protein
MARSEGRKEWIDSYDIFEWGAEPIAWLVLIIITVVGPVPVAVFFGMLPFFIVTPISLAVAALSVYFLIRRLERDAEERDKSRGYSRPAR